MVGRVELRRTLVEFLQPPKVDGLNMVFDTVPKRAWFQENALPSQKSRAMAVVFIESERETRLSVGGATSGVKRVDYQVAIQVFHRSTERDATDAMNDFDQTMDNLKTRLRSDHQFGDSSGVFIWQGAEPMIDVSYGEPFTETGGTLNTLATLRFDVTQMVQA